MRFEIELAGEKKECSFGINATELFCELKGLELNQIGEKIGEDMSMIDMRDLVYCGIKAACLESGVEMDLNKFQVGSALDSMDGDGLFDILQKFMGSLPKWTKDKKKVKPHKAKKGGKPKLPHGKR